MKSVFDPVLSKEFTSHFVKFILVTGVFGWSLNLMAQTKNSTWSLVISEWSMSYSKLYSFSSGGVTIMRHMNAETETYTVEIEAQNLQRLREPICQIPERNLAGSYVNDLAPDDLPEFEFTFSCDNQQTTCRVYQRGVPELLKLVEELNNFLPEKWQIPYNRETILSPDSN